MNLLIVDDDPTSLKLLRAQLESEGHVVFEAHDGVDALAALERQRVDAVISDILMPRMDGYRLCHEIRKRARLHDLPFIISTSTYTSPGDEKLALDVGADKYFKKPVSVKTIITALHEVIAKPHAAPRPEALQEIEVLKEYSERLVFKLEEKNTELMAAETKFRALVEQSIVGIYIIQDDQFVYVNPRMAGIFGRSEEEMTSRTLSDFVVPEDQALARENIRRRMSGEVQSVHYSLRVLHQSGAVLQVEVHGSRTDYNGRPAVMGTLLDISERKRAEIALRNSEGRLRLITDNVLDLVSQVGPDGAYVYVSPSYQRVLGYSPQSLLGTSAFELVHAGDLERVRAVFAEAVQLRVSGRSDFRCRHADGHYVWLEAIGTLLLDETGAPNGAVLSARDITAHQRANDALKDAHMRLQSLSRRLLNIQETERRSLARELHDEIGQALTATKINLQALERFPNPATLASRLRDANSIVERALEQVRSLSLELRPPLLDDLGLPAALRWLLDQHARRSGLQVQFVNDPFEGRPGAEVETACFRIAQQGLMNVVKHAGARTVRVELRRVGDALHLHVRDDGAGFDVLAARARAMRGESLGLLSMEERAALAGGGIEWTPAPGRGTDVHAWFALAPTTRP